MSNRDELISKLEQRFHEPYEHGASLCNLTIEDVADFIIEDRKRIVEPLVNAYYNPYFPKMTMNGQLNKLYTATVETLKLSGVSNGKG